MNNTNQFIKNWLPTILWICCIFIMSTDSFSSKNTYSILVPVIRFFIPNITPAEIDTVHFLVRKGAHITEYCIASLLLFHSFKNTMQFSRNWLWVFCSFIVVLIVAATDEYHQAFVATRTSSIIDIGIDLIGGVIGQGIGFTLHQFCRSREK